jgi:hypothetical protein
VDYYNGASFRPILFALCALHEILRLANAFAWMRNQDMHAMLNRLFRELAYICMHTHCSSPRRNQQAPTFLLMYLTGRPGTFGMLCIAQNLLLSRLFNCEPNILMICLFGHGFIWVSICKYIDACTYTQLRPYLLHCMRRSNPKASSYLT